MAPSVVVLLPICAELESDDPADHVFQIILKNAIARKIDENYLGIAFKAGMSADKIVVGSEILSENWKNLASAKHRTMQSKLLGFWAIKNYPLMGKKFFGDGWKVPQRKSVEVNSKKIDCNEIDQFIFRKMKLTLVELTVSESTLEKLKHFVRAPPIIVKYNPVMISQKAKMFDIHRDYLDTCWNALKNGQFSINMPSPPLCTSECRVALDRIMEQPIDLSKNAMSIPTKISDVGESGNLSAKRARLNSDLHGVLSNDLFEMVVEIRDNVRMAVQSGGFDGKSIDQTKSELNDKISQVEEERNGWARYATSKEDELNAAQGKLVEAEKLRLEMAQKMDDMKAEQKRYLERKEMELNEARNELAIKSGKLGQIRREMVQKAEEKEEELRKVKDEFAAMNVKLNESEKMRLEMVKKLEAKDTELKEARDELTKEMEAKEAELNRAKEELTQLQDQRNAWANYATSKEQEVASGKSELENWTRCAKSKECELKEAWHDLETSKTNYRKLEEEFHSYKKNVEGMIPELRSRILELEVDSGNTVGIEDGTVSAIIPTPENIGEDTAKDLKEGQGKQSVARPRRTRARARQ